MRIFRILVVLIVVFVLVMMVCFIFEVIFEVVLCVSVVIVGLQVVQCDDELFGCVVVVCIVQICVQVGGIVQCWLFDQGVEVSVGQVLFQIDLVVFWVDVDLVLVVLQCSEVVFGCSCVQLQCLYVLVVVQVVSQQYCDDVYVEYEQVCVVVNEVCVILLCCQFDLCYVMVSVLIVGCIDQVLVIEGVLVGVVDVELMVVVQQIDQVYVDVC